MTKSQLEAELHNTRQAMKEVLDYAFLAAIASEHLAYAILMQKTGETELFEKNVAYALQAMRESYELMPSHEWAEKIGYLWGIAETSAVIQ
jgi:hypothetical protein